MTEHKFPDPQRIDWDALEHGDTVWVHTSYNADGLLEAAAGAALNEIHQAQEVARFYAALAGLNREMVA